MRPATPNLGWKLAAALAGWAGPELLGSYDAERRPVFYSTAKDFIEKAIAKEGDENGNNNRAHASCVPTIHLTMTIGRPPSNAEAPRRLSVRRTTPPPRTAALGPEAGRRTSYAAIDRQAEGETSRLQKMVRLHLYKELSQDKYSQGWWRAPPATHHHRRPFKAASFPADAPGDHGAALSRLCCVPLRNSPIFSWALVAHKSGAK